MGTGWGQKGTSLRSGCWVEVSLVGGLVLIEGLRFGSLVCWLYYQHNGTDGEQVGWVEVRDHSGQGGPQQLDGCFTWWVTHKVAREQNVWYSVSPLRLEKAEAESKGGGGPERPHTVSPASFIHAMSRERLVGDVA